MENTARRWRWRALGVALLALQAMAVAADESADTMQQVHPLYEQLLSANHGDTFSPYGAIYYESENAADELLAMGPSGITLLLRALDEGRHGLIVTRRLAESDDPRVIPALQRKATEWEGGYGELWVRHALYRLGVLPDVQFVVFEELLTGANAPAAGSGNVMYEYARDASVKSQVATIAGYMADDRTVDLLHRALQLEPAIDWEVAIGLEYTRNPTATPLLIEMLDARLAQPDDEGTADVVQTLIAGIGACGGEPSIPYLRGLASPDRPWLLPPVIRSLATSPDPEASDLLADIAVQVAHDDRLVSRVCLSIGYRGDAELVPVLLDYLDLRVSTRRSALDALGAMGQRLDLLEEALGDEDRSIRTAAIQALLDVEDGGPAILWRFVDSSDSHTFEPLCELSETGDEQATRRLVARWASMDVDERAYTLFTLEGPALSVIDQDLAPLILDALNEPVLVEHGLDLLAEVLERIDSPAIARDEAIKQRLLELDREAAEYVPGAPVHSSHADPGILLLCLCGPQDAAIRDEILLRLPTTVAAGRRDKLSRTLHGRLPPDVAAAARDAFDNPPALPDPGAALLRPPTADELACVLQPGGEGCDDVHVTIVEGVGVMGIRPGISTMDDVESLFPDLQPDIDGGTAHYPAQGMSFTWCADDPRRAIISLWLQPPFPGRTTQGLVLGTGTIEQVKQIYRPSSGYRTVFGETRWKELHDRTRFHIPSGEMGGSPDPGERVVRIDLVQPDGITNRTCD
jgi:HEAT repeat protein